MKKILYILLISFFVITISGCKSDNDKASTNSAPPDPPLGTGGLPAEAYPPATITIDYLLNIVNDYLGTNEDGSIIFDKEYVQKIDALPVSESEPFIDDDVIYIFKEHDNEIALFANSKSDCFTRGYLRMLYYDELTEYYMVTFAGAFAAVLEPNEFDNMLNAIMPTEYIEEYTDEYVAQTYSGEFWTFSYNRGIVNIAPKDPQ